MSRTLALTLTLLTLTACIRRYPAPEEPEEAVTPYSAFAAMHSVVPPAGAADPLPDAALRLAISDRGWMADTALVDGSAGTLTLTQEAAMELLLARSEPVVVLVNAELAGEPGTCESLSLLGDRVRVAVGALAFGRDAADARDAASGLSRDPLSGAHLERICPGQGPR